jgi:hypothetical protein
VDNKRIYAIVAAVAVVVHIGALWNRFAIDDLTIIRANELVHSLDGVWRSFVMPYWPADLGGRMYRPLALASFAIDWQLSGGSAMWFHAVNLLWHALGTVVVAMLARRFIGPMGALAAGLLFAVHPVHVEAIAISVGRNETMAALFACLAVYLALFRQSVGWSAVCFAAGLLAKENAAVVPGLIGLAWLLGFDRPSRRRVLAHVATWVVVVGLYAAARWAVLHPFSQYTNAGPVFIEQGEVAVRLTAVYALSDVFRLLVFPLTLRVDYSPAERSIVLSPFDGRFLIGLACLALWAALFVMAWRRGRRVEAFGLGWVGIAFLPVANLLFPIGVLVAERALYLPSVGLVLAAGALLERLENRRYWTVLTVLVAAGAVRSAVRVPVWRSDSTVTLSILDDSPRSYVGPFWTGALLLSSNQPEKALRAYQESITIFDRASIVYMGAAAAAFATHQPDLANTYLQRADRYCGGCAGLYRAEANRALTRGDSATADSLLARARRIDSLRSPRP